MPFIIADKIYELRQSKKLTQKELADMLNVTDKTVSRWETRKSLPDVEMMKRIADVFEISISELYDNVDSPIDMLIPVSPHENVDTKILKFVKVNITSYILIIFAAIVFLLIKYLGSIDINSIQGIKFVVDIVLLILSLGLLISSIIIELTNFTDIIYYSKYTFTRSRMKRVIIWNAIVYILVFGISCFFALFFILFK